MADLSSKKPVRRVRKAASSPAPVEPGSSMGPTCGHMNCVGGTCGVRYVGPTSHIRDHHIMHAAYGASQVWTAAIVAGLAIVITGVFAFSSVQAKQQDLAVDTSVRAESVEQRLDLIEATLQKVSTQCAPPQQLPTSAQLEAVMGGSGSKLK